MTTERGRGDSYYRWFPGDYLRDTGTLSLIEHGAYRLLLDHYYSEAGNISDEKPRLYRLCRATTPEEQQAVDFIVMKYFPIKNGLLTNNRADRELLEREQFIEEQRRKGKLGGRPPKKAEEKPGGNPGVSPGFEKQKPEESLPSPSPSIDQTLLSDSSISDGSNGDARKPNRPRKRITYPNDFNEFWSAYPRPIGKVASYEAWLKIRKDEFPAADIVRSAQEYSRQMEREKREESKIRHPERFLKKDFWKEFCLAD